MRGDQVLAELQEDPGTRDIPVVVVSADATPGQIDRLRAAGVWEYLTKLLDVRQFAATIDQLLERASPDD